MKRLAATVALLVVGLASARLQAQRTDFINVGGRFLQVVGTESSDTIVVAFNSDQTRITVTVSARTSGRVLLRREFATRDVPRLILEGQGGNDFIRNNTDIESVVFGGDGRDEIHGGDRIDVIFGDRGDDRLFGGADNDVLAGCDGADFLDGQAGDDLLVGGNYGPLFSRFQANRNGDDEVHADSSPDTMIGGAGIDRFAFQPDDARVGVHRNFVFNGEMSVAQKHSSIFWIASAWPRNGGWFNPVRIWQARG